MGWVALMTLTSEDIFFRCRHEPTNLIDFSNNCLLAYLRARDLWTLSLPRRGPAPGVICFRGAHVNWCTALPGSSRAVPVRELRSPLESAPYLS